MIAHLGKYLKIFVVIILFSSFLLVLSASVFVIYFPTTTIQFIERFIPEKEIEPVRIRGIGILGDSQADEYRGDDNRGLTFAPTTLNWVEQLEKYRNLNFGSWGTWGEPRRTGYAYNWARTGATVNSVFENGQLEGLAEQVKNGEVNVVIISIGANDYAPFITPDGYDAHYNGSLSSIDILRKRNTIVSDITTAIEILNRAGDVTILIALIPDWGNHLGVRIAFPLPEPRKRVADAILDTNNAIKRVAADYGIVTIDPNDYYKKVFSESISEIVVGGERFTAIIPGDDPHSLFLEDGTHAGTVLNGLFANEVIAGLNQALNGTIRPFSEQEILDHAGL